MKKRTTFLKKNKKGSTLMLVVGICSILLIFLTTSLSVAQLARQQTYIQYNKKQAYYSANSAVNLFAKNATSDADLKDFISNMAAGSSFTSNRINIEGLGEVEYIVSKTSSGSVKVTAKAYYNNAVSESSVILSGNGKDTRIPQFEAASVSHEEAGFSNGFLATGDVVAWTDNAKMQMTNTGKVFGNVYVVGDLETNDHSAIFQGGKDSEYSIIVTGRFYITNNVNIEYSPTVSKAYINCKELKSDARNFTLGMPEKKIDVHCNSLDLDGGSTSKYYSNIYVYKTVGSANPPYVNLNGVTINGDLYIDDNFSLNGHTHNAVINGNLIVNGTFKVDSNNGLIVNGNVYCKKFVGSTSGWTLGNNGKIYSPDGSLRGSYEVNWDETTDRPVLATRTKPSIPDPEEVFAPYTVDVSTYINQDAITNGERYENVANNTVIDKSGVLIGSLWQKKIKIKVKEENIWLQLDVNQIGESEIIIEKDPNYPNTCVYFVIPGNVQIHKSIVMTSETKSKLEDGNSVFYVGNRDNTAQALTKGQEVYWLLNDGSLLDITGSAGAGSTIEGYIYGPKATVKSDNKGAYTTKYTLNGKTNGDNLREISPHIIGASVVQKITISNEGGILYLIPRSEGLGSGVIGGPGGGASSWKVDKFVRK